MTFLFTGEQSANGDSQNQTFGAKKQLRDHLIKIFNFIDEEIKLKKGCSLSNTTELLTSEA